MIFNKFLRTLILFFSFGTFSDAKCYSSVADETVKLVASDGAANDALGYAVSISNGTVLVGAYTVDIVGSNEGAAYLYYESFPGARDYINEVKLVPSDGLDFDLFGAAVCIDGPYAAIGTQAGDKLDSPIITNVGSVYVFTESYHGARDWAMNENKILPSDGADGDYFGTAISISGSTLMIGAQKHVDGGVGGCTGAVYFFRESSFLAGDWMTSETKVCAAYAFTDHKYGFHLDISERNAIVGAEFDRDNGIWSGAVYFYKESTPDARDWQSNEVKVIASDGTGSDVYGSAVGISGQNAAVGARNVKVPYGNCGAVYFYRETSLGAQDWSSHELKIVPSDAAASDEFGHSLAMSGSLVVVGAPYTNYDGGIDNAGSIYAFTESVDGAGDWTSFQMKWTPDVPGLNNHFGYDVQIDGNMIVVGEKLGDDATDNVGVAYVVRANCVDECESSPCFNGGVCNDKYDSFKCSCMSQSTGYTGDVCEIDIDDCISNPCLNNGTCVDNGPLDFTCVCDGTGFEDDTCSSNVDECLSSPCENGGQCKEYLGTGVFHCDCTGTGFDGDTCITDIDDCLSSPCLNNGICFDNGTHSYTCACEGTGFEGKNCNIDSDDCVSSPCANGNCKDIGQHQFQCRCDVGYQGYLCESDIDDCISSPCLNDATCTDAGVQNVTCECSLGFTGSFCEADVDDCNSSPCQNNGLCVDTGMNVFNCICPGNYSGIVCDEALTSDFTGNEVIASTSDSSSSTSNQAENVQATQAKPENDDPTILIIIIVSCVVIPLLGGIAFYLNNQRKVVIINEKGEQYNMPV